MTYEDFIEHEESCDSEQAVMLLLLTDPDAFGGTLEEYCELEERYKRWL